MSDVEDFRQKARRIIKHVAHIAVNGVGDIHWDDGTVEEASPAQEDGVLGSYAVQLIEPVESYESALSAALAERDRLAEQIEEARQWAKAYPVKVFPEITDAGWETIARTLKENGAPSLDRVSAANMRHVLAELVKIFQPALTSTEGK